MACQAWVDGTIVREFAYSPLDLLPPYGQRVVLDLLNILASATPVFELRTIPNSRVEAPSPRGMPARPAGGCHRRWASIENAAGKSFGGRRSIVACRQRTSR